MRTVGNNSSIRKFSTVKVTKPTPTTTPVKPVVQEAYADTGVTVNTDKPVKKKRILQKQTPGSPKSFIGEIGTGITNQVFDYQGIVNMDYEEKSILNKAINKTIQGDFQGAGQIITQNPGRFIGNVIVEVGTNFIPVGAALKVVKGTKIAKQVIDKTKKAEKFYQFSGKDGYGSGGGTFWYSKKPDGYYALKHVSEDGDQVFLREVDIPKKTDKSFEKLESDYYRVENQVGDANLSAREYTRYIGIDKKTYDAAKKNISTSKERQELESTRNFDQYQYFDYEKLPDGLIKQINKDRSTTPIGYITKDMSLDIKNEWAFPLDYTSKSKTITGFGSEVSDKESLINRIVKPWNTSNKLANRAVKAGFNPKTDPDAMQYLAKQKAQATTIAKQSAGQIKKASQLNSMQKAGLSGELDNIAGGLDDLATMFSTPKIQKVDYYGQFVSDSSKVYRNQNILGYTGLGYNTLRVGSTVISNTSTGKEKTTSLRKNNKKRNQF